MTEESRETLAGRAYREVQEAIATGELAPNEKITERGLAERLDMSPTPVREALRRLEQDGMIQRSGPRTVVVADIGAAAVEDLVEVEVALRGLIARFAARRATPSQLDHLDALLDEADDLLIVSRQRLADGRPVERHLGTLLDVMQRFNDAVADCAGNAVLVRLLDQTRVFTRAERKSRTLERVLANHERNLARYAGHRALVRALRAGDAETAERLAIEDVRAGLEDLRREPDRSRTPGPVA
ncbi:DNA-binding transcriptional regulator, GntR family [Lentzea fradiae]|uniref:DNA-binding transcriptional regulator, GntR family n=1 Tax=Lentzea fradiae TaxID=200378 RepID=A0A1G7NK45_9PSEU|nr:GntR family transcriptional regulator [Lentzea fradiae]SDF74444.1 DNA-binding transcriptional regulator, GntR family [Lentzea fradiae]